MDPDGQTGTLDLAFTYQAALPPQAKSIFPTLGSVNGGTTVTLDMEDHATTDSTLDILARLRADYPGTGAVLQAYLRRTESDCRELAGEGSRVRLCKGAYREPESVAYTHRLDVDKSYVRCLNILMSGEGYPMLATHDPRLIAIAKQFIKERNAAPSLCMSMKISPSVPSPYSPVWT